MLNRVPLQKKKDIYVIYIIRYIRPYWMHRASNVHYLTTISIILGYINLCNTHLSDDILSCTLFAHFSSAHPIYPYSKSLGTHTRGDIPTARVRRKKPYVHWTLILNVHRWQERGGKNVRDLRERAVLLFNGKNRGRREGAAGDGRKTDVGKISRLSGLDGPTDGAAALRGHWRSTVFRIFLRGPFRTCPVLHERTVDYTFISFTGQVIL